MDRALDGALRDVAAAEPPAGLRERVMARLATDKRAAYRFGRLALPTAAAVIAALLAGVRLARGPSPYPPVPSHEAANPSPATTARPPVAGPGLPEPASPLGRETPRAAAVLARRPAVRPGAPALRAAAVPPRDASDDAALPPLAGPPALRATDLASVEVQAPAPIAVPALGVEPLDEGEPTGSGFP